MKTRPIAAARWISVRCVAGRRSMRAAMSACSVSGMRSAPARGRSASMRIVSSTKSGLPSVFASTAAASIGSSRSRVSASTSSALSSACSGSSSIAVARTRPPPQLGRMSSSSRAREAEQQQRRLAHRGGEVLDELEQRLLGPVDVLEDEHERLRLARAARPTRVRPRRSPAGCARPRRPRARRPRGRAGRRPPRPRSRRAASSAPRRAGRRR